MAFTLTSLVEQGLLRPWRPEDERLAWRAFYFSEPWQLSHSRLPKHASTRQVRGYDDQENETPLEDDGSDMVDPTLDPSPQGQLNGLIKTFVVGWRRDKLIRRVGFGMEPPFRRMRPPRSRVVKMRTPATRTFGFFARQGVFVAHRVDLADNTHADESLYEKYGDDVLRLMKRMIPSDRDEASDVEILIGEGR